METSTTASWGPRSADAAFAAATGAAGGVFAQPSSQVRRSCSGCQVSYLKMLRRDTLDVSARSAKDKDEGHSQSRSIPPSQPATSEFVARTSKPHSRAPRPGCHTPHAGATTAQTAQPRWFAGGLPQATHCAKKTRFSRSKFVAWGGRIEKKIGKFASRSLANSPPPAAGGPACVLYS